MVACAKNGKFDLVITKESSRFARNTPDSIYYTRELKKYGVGVIFLNDNIASTGRGAAMRQPSMAGPTLTGQGTWCAVQG